MSHCATDCHTENPKAPNCVFCFLFVSTLIKQLLNRPKEGPHHAAKSRCAADRHTIPAPECGLCSFNFLLNCNTSDEAASEQPKKGLPMRPLSQRAGVEPHGWGPARTKPALPAKAEKMWGSYIFFLAILLINQPDSYWSCSCLHPPRSKPLPCGHGLAVLLPSGMAGRSRQDQDCLLLVPPAAVCKSRGFRPREVTLLQTEDAHGWDPYPPVLEERSEVL
jgi:hypothetical protein